MKVYQISPQINKKSKLSFLEAFSKKKIQKLYEFSFLSLLRYAALSSSFMNHYFWQGRMQKIVKEGALYVDHQGWPRKKFLVSNGLKR